MEPKPAPALTEASPRHHLTLGRRGKIKWLDGLRGLAALLVVARHAGYIEAHDVGAPAVDAFFVLSAFLLTLGLEPTVRSLLHRPTPATHRTWAWVLAEYAMRRLLRVYPLFALVACFLAVLPAPWRATLFRIEDPAQFDLVQVLVFSFDFRYHVFWSLPVEIGYYCLLPVVVVVAVKLERHWWWALGVPLYALVFASGFFFHRTRHQPMWPHVPTFLCGSLAAIIYSKLQVGIAKRQLAFELWQRLLIRSVELFFLAVMLSVVFDGLFFHWVGPNPLPQQSGGTRFTSFHVTVVLVAELALPGGPIASLLESPPLLYAGKVSYSMYLLHSFVVYAPCVQRMAYYDRFFATWGLVFALSALAHAAVEVPCLRLASRLGEHMKQRRSRGDYAALPCAESA